MNLTRPEIVVWTGVGIALVGVLALAFVAGRERRGDPKDASEPAGVAEQRKSALLPEPISELGDHACIERSGRAMNTSELRGNVLVLDFIFTNCGGTCPAMTSKMKELQASVASLPDVRLVSVSVDPERDTVAALSAYADGVGADKDRWLFLRCEPPVLRDIAYDRLHLVVSPTDMISHQSKFVLVDRAGRARALYDPLSDPTWLGTLVADLDVVRHEPQR